MNLTVVDSAVPGLIVLGLFGTLGIFLYFLPSIIASARNLPQSNSVFLLNLFLGWTLLRLGHRHGHGLAVRSPLPR